MSARYGSRTRTGEAVSGFGQRATGAGGTRLFYEEVFTAPGTWTWPGNVGTVEVTVVGGGGGGQNGGSANPAQRQGSGGGGGLVVTQMVPVAAPVPVTVGAGGSAGPAPSPTLYPGPGAAGSPGGISGFGPLGPGPIPTIPATTIVAGGGQGGRDTSIPPIDERKILGGAAYGSLGTPNVAPRMYGINAYPQIFHALIAAPGAPSQTAYPSGSGSSPAYNHAGFSVNGFGGGGALGGTVQPFDGGRLNGSAAHGGGRGGWYQLNINSPSPTAPGVVQVAATPGTANTGGGGGGGGGTLLTPPAPHPLPTPAQPAFAGGNGGSGVVIVRWTE